MISFSNITITEGSVTEPVTLDEVKDWLQIDFDDFDSVLISMITGARQSVENYLGWSVVPKTITLDMENPKDIDSMPLPYARGVTTVVVNEVDDYDVATLQTVGTDYYLRGNILRLYAGRYSVSYVTVPGTIPEAVKEAIKMEVAERYRARGENDSEGKQGLSEAAKAKLAPYQTIWL